MDNQNQTDQPDQPANAPEPTTSTEPKTVTEPPLSPDVNTPPQPPIPVEQSPEPFTQATQHQTTEAKPLNQTDKLKRTFFQILIGCLIASASIAVIAVLIGSFNDVLGRALGTLAMVALHAIFSFSYISNTEKQDKKDGGRSIALFSNTVFVLIVVSFITSIFALWELLGGEITFKLYLFYGVILFATLHAEVLYRLRGYVKNIDSVITANYLFMGIVTSLLTLAIFSMNSFELGEVFYRILAAAFIVDITMTITVSIMHRLFLQKHPELAIQADQANAQPAKSFWRNPLVVIFLIFVAVPVVTSLFALFAFLMH